MVSRSRREKPRQHVKSQSFSFDGGLNLVDPPLSTPDGMLLGVSNFELRVRGGYRRIDGIERFDGNDSPSEATYFGIDFDAGTNEPAVGQIISGQTSLALGRIIFVQVDSGSFATNDATGIFVTHVHAGVFQDGETIVNGHDSFSIGFDNGFF